MKLIEYDYLQKKANCNNTIKKYNKKTKKNTKVKALVKINKTNVIKGIFEVVLPKLIKGTLTNNDYNKFNKSYVVLIKNEKDRTFPRFAITPFKKWYIKGYSDITKYSRIVNAINNKKVNKLDKNLKVLAKKIISINGKKCK